MDKEVLAAVIGAAGTIIAALISVWVTMRQRSAKRLTSDDRSTVKRSTPTEDHQRPEDTPVVPDIQAPGTTLAELSSSDASASVTLLYPGSDRFSYSSVRYSSVSVTLDGKQVGAGEGLIGFQCTFEAALGKHTLVFTWSEEREEQLGDRDKEMERERVVFWLLGKGRCKIHLSDCFDIDGVEPPIAVPACYACSQPGLRRCTFKKQYAKCNKRYCEEHKGAMAGQDVCQSCMSDIREAHASDTGCSCLFGVAVAVAYALYCYFSK